MNISRLFFAFVMSIFLISCSGDDSSSISTRDSLLVGTWFLKQVNGVDQEAGDCEKQSNKQFTSTKKYIETAYYNLEGTCVLDAVDEGVWELENNILKVTWPGYDADDNFPDTWSILELTNITLKMRLITDGEDYDYVATFRK